MASRRERCRGCGRQLLIPLQAVTIQCSACQAVTRFQPFEQRVQAPAPGPRRFNRVSTNNNNLNMGFAGGSVNDNGFNNYADQQGPTLPLAPRRPRFNRVRTNINPNMVAAADFDQHRPQSVPMPPVPAIGRKRALLCGICYNGTSYKLSGSINDVKRMWILLVDTFGYPRESVLMLTEQEMNPKRFPTKQNIRSALRWLVQDCQPGDSLFFHYSGHGSRQKDYNQDEIDGFDETICPLDFETEGPVLDDEINATIVRPLPPGVKLHAVIDTCYSGTILDLPYMCRINREGNYGWEDQRYARAVYKGTNGGIAISFSACADHQTSASTSVFTGREVTGAMTLSFTQAVQNAPGLTYGQVLNAMHNIVPSLVPADDSSKLQEPQLCASQKFDIYSTKFTL